MMATVTEMREWLRDQGHDVPQRGRLRPELVDLYADAHAIPPPPDADWDLGDEPLDVIDPGELEPSVPLEPERPPKTARSERAVRRSRPVTERIFGRKPAKPTTKAKKVARVSVEHLISRCWEGVARIAQPVSLPMSRCLQVQSPVAGAILEEIVAGTVVDRALQPIARAEEKAEKVLALVAPPLLVLALEQTANMEPQQAMIRQAIITPMLKESLRIWIQVAGPKVEEAARKEQEYMEKFGHTIDEMIGLFFAPPPGMESQPQPEPEMAGAAA